MSWSTKYWLLIGAGVAGLLLYFGAYQYGFIRGSALLQPGDDELGRLHAELTRVEGENRAHNERYDQLWAELARARRELQINKTTYTELSRSLDESAAMITELREQLDFYERILDTTGETTGLRIHEFVVRQIGATGQYRYEVLLVNMANDESRFEGEVEIELEGTRDGQTMLYGLADIGSPARTVKMKYFQALRGNFELPDGFQPTRTRVGVRPASDTNPETEKWFPWNPM